MFQTSALLLLGLAEKTGTQTMKTSTGANVNKRDFDAKMERDFICALNMCASSQTKQNLERQLQVFKTKTFLWKIIFKSESFQINISNKSSYKTFTFSVCNLPQNSFQRKAKPGYRNLRRRYVLHI